MANLPLLVVNGPTTLTGNLNFGENGTYGSVLFGDYRGKESGDWRFSAGHDEQKIVFQNVLNEALLTIDCETGQIIFDGAVTQGTESLISTTTLTNDDGEYIFCNAISGGFTVTLPLASLSLGKQYSFVKTDATASVVTIDGAGSETINGSATTTLTAQYQTVTVACNGTTWYRLGSATDITALTLNVTNLISLSGVAANASNLGTFTGTTIADSSTVKTALQSLETSLESAVATNTSQATNITNLTTLSGVAANATSLGTFTGATIADNQTNKQALQALETSLETNNTTTSNLVTLSGVATNATNLGTFTGSTIADNQTVKVALQSLETAVEAAGTAGDEVGATITSNTTLTASSEKYQPCSSASSPITITLPNASVSEGLEFTFYRTNTSVNTITIDGAGANTIDGFANVVLRWIDERLTIWCNGAKWIKKEHFASSTFIPVLEGTSTPGTHTYAVQSGVFNRIMDRIFFNIRILLTNKDAAMAGNVRISGLPVISSATVLTHSCSIGFLQNFGLGSCVQIGAIINDSTSVLEFRKSVDAAAATTPVAADIVNTTGIQISGSYLIDN